MLDKLKKLDLFKASIYPRRYEDKSYFGSIFGFIWSGIFIGVIIFVSLIFAWTINQPRNSVWRFDNVFFFFI